MNDRNRQGRAGQGRADINPEKGPISRSDHIPILCRTAQLSMHCTPFRKQTYTVRTYCTPYIPVQYISRDTALEICCYPALQHVGFQRYGGRRAGNKTGKGLGAPASPSDVPRAGWLGRLCGKYGSQTVVFKVIGEYLRYDPLRSFPESSKGDGVDVADFKQKIGITKECAGIREQNADLIKRTE